MAVAKEWLAQVANPGSVVWWKEHRGEDSWGVGHRLWCYFELCISEERHKSWVKACSACYLVSLDFFQVLKMCTVLYFVNIYPFFFYHVSTHIFLRVLVIETFWVLCVPIVPSAMQLFCRACVCVFVPTFVLVYTSPHPPFHSTTQEKEDEAEEQRSPKRNYYWFNHIISRKHFRPR